MRLDMELLRSVNVSRKSPVIQRECKWLCKQQNQAGIIVQGS